MFMYVPSLIGVYLIVLAFPYAQYNRHGFITPQMWCFVGFWFAYLFTLYALTEASGVAEGTGGPEAVALIATTDGVAATLAATFTGAPAAADP